MNGDTAWRKGLSLRGMVIPWAYCLGGQFFYRLFPNSAGGRPPGKGWGMIWRKSANKLPAKPNAQWIQKSLWVELGTGPPFALAPVSVSPHKSSRYHQQQAAVRVQERTSPTSHGQLRPSGIGAEDIVIVGIRR